jgi:protein-L-isoaspartate O-methyltransferase
VLKLNRVGGTLNSVSTTPLRHWHGSSTKVEIERVKDYRAPGPGDTEKVIAATKLPPLCNYPGEGFAQMTQAEWDKKHKDYKTTRAVEATATHARHRVRHAMTTGYKYGHIFITDAKRVDPPAAPLAPAGPEVFAREKDSRQGTDLSPSMEMSRTIHAAIPKDDRIPSYEQLHEMDKAAAAGVQVVIAPQLFPTPPELADRMVALADIRPGQQVLEPSAGTGRIVDAIRRNAHGYAITAVELNCNMAHRLRTVDGVDDTRQADFLECNGDLGTFDRIVMNPPFANADDIKHIMHALKMLKPGGRLVAICANGPRQNDKLRPIVEARGGIWEELPSDTFISTGTSVRTVLLMLDA